MKTNSCCRHRWGATGPGNGFYHDNTVILTMNTNYGTNERRSFCLYSTDEGTTWQKTKDAGTSIENQIIVDCDGYLENSGPPIKDTHGNSSIAFANEYIAVA